MMCIMRYWWHASWLFSEVSRLHWVTIRCCRCLEHVKRDVNLSAGKAFEKRFVFLALDFDLPWWNGLGSPHCFQLCSSMSFVFSSDKRERHHCSNSLQGAQFCHVFG